MAEVTMVDQVVLVVQVVVQVALHQVHHKTIEALLQQTLVVEEEDQVDNLVTLQEVGVVTVVKVLLL